MEMSDNHRIIGPSKDRKYAHSKQGSQKKKAIIFIVVVGMLLGLWLSIPYVILPYLRDHMGCHLICGTHLSGLHKAFVIYATENHEQFPTYDKWCDILMQDGEVSENVFVCRGMKEGRCSYSMNPNADTVIANPNWVLLFESNGGWNSYGGSEMVTTDNHGGVGCNVLFVDGRVEFVTKEGFDKLRWGRKIDRDERGSQ